LERIRMDWKSVPGNITTTWAEAIDPSAPLPEYPRPQMVRPDWHNLNGLWEYVVTEKEAECPDSFEGIILVPFAIETALSGVKRPLQPNQRLWYRRLFAISEAWSGRRILLHFEAVDWQCACYLNGKEIGKHTGGYVPFHFDITEHLISGENELVVAVWDPSDTHWQQRGKQVLKPKAIYYTATSGIWQTVWLEPVPNAYVETLRLTPDLSNQSVEVLVGIEGSPDPLPFRVTILDGDRPAAEAEGITGEALSVSVPEPRLWSPDGPFLYGLQQWGDFRRCVAFL